jgi:putative drug exporter of the RND superfamily
MTPTSERRPRRRPSRLSGYTGLLTRHPRFAFFSWLVLVLALGMVGRNLADHLEPHLLNIPGTEANQAHEITLRQFGSDESMVVALRGPPAAVESQGKRLAAQIDAQPGTIVVSPWSLEKVIDGLRPEPDVAGIVIRVGRQNEDSLTAMLEQIEGRVEATVRPPVKASIAGRAKIFSSDAHANESATNTGEMIAVPVLLLVLLLVFRSIVAALIPIVVGGIVVSATEGVMRLLLGVFQIDAFALGAAGMMGLALGVDYSLLTISRFREERKTAPDLQSAVRVTVEATARSIVPAGAGLVLAMLIAAQVLPGTVVSSSALAIVIATALSGFSALFAVPALIMMLGDRLDRWSLPQRYSMRRGPLWFSKRIANRPRVVIGIVFALLFLGFLSTTLETGVSTPGLLPKDEAGRIEAERVRQALGPGWLAPIEVVVSDHGEPLTSPANMRSLVSFQKRIETEPGVEGVAGFSRIEHNLKPLSDFEAQLVKQQHGVNRLGRSLARTENGAQRNSSGLRQAAAGAGELGRNVRDASAGAGLLIKGLNNTGTGSSRIAQGLSHASDGSDTLAQSSSKSSNGAARLTKALEKGQERVDETNGNINSMKSAMHAGSAELTKAQAPLTATEQKLAAAWQGLLQMTTGKTDPQYAAVQEALREARENINGGPVAEGEEATAATPTGVGADIVHAQRQFELGLYLARKIGDNNDKAGEGTEKLAKEARRLNHGIEKLTDGAAKVADGITTLSKEGEALSPALQRLTKGTESLAQGLGNLAGGATDLSSGLSGGAGGAAQLASALSRMHAGIQTRPGGLRQLQERSPNLFNSGYFFLAGLDGSNPKQRSLANFMVDVESGGHAARIMVIPVHPVTTLAGRRTLENVRDDAQTFAKVIGAEAVIGGQAASQLTINDTIRGRTTLARLAMMLVTLLILIPVLRSLTVPILSAFLNLLTVFASLGVVALVFNNSLFGGPGYVDVGDVPASMMVIFGLAIDYEVFIFARMREEYVRTGSPIAAVDNGLARTAPVVTGAAVIMIIVFVAFSFSDFITLRNFGVAQATAIFIDAFILRLIIVPAAMKAMGRWSFWMPGWLDRLLPGGGSGPEP